MKQEPKKLENTRIEDSRKVQVQTEQVGEKFDVRAEVDQLKVKMNKVWQLLDIKN